MKGINFGMALIFCSCLASGAGAQALTYMNQTEIGFLAGNPGAPSRSVFTLQTFNGVTLVKGLAGGITVGLDVYPELTVLPLSLGLRGDVFQAGVSPYYSVDIGYGFDWLQKETEFDRYSGGWMLNPAIGLRIKTRSHTGILFSIGYKYQRAGFYDAEPSAVFLSPAFEALPPGVAAVSDEVYKFNRMSVRMGVSF